VVIGRRAREVDHARWSPSAILREPYRIAIAAPRTKEIPTKRYASGGRAHTLKPKCSAPYAAPVINPYKPATSSGRDARPSELAMTPLAENGFQNAAMANARTRNRATATAGSTRKIATAGRRAR